MTVHEFIVPGWILTQNPLPCVFRAQPFLAQIHRSWKHTDDPQKQTKVSTSNLTLTCPPWRWLVPLDWSPTDDVSPIRWPPRDGDPTSSFLTTRLWFPLGVHWGVPFVPVSVPRMSRMSSSMVGSIHQFRLSTIPPTSYRWPCDQTLTNGTQLFHSHWNFDDCWPCSQRHFVTLK